MAEQTSSFIPKNSKRVERKVRTTKRIYLLSYISYVVFFGTLLLVVGVYLYDAQVQSELEAVKAQVQQERQRFAPSDVISELKMLDRQLSLSAELLANSAAPSQVLSEIESITASNIQFTGLLYEYLPNRQFQITLTGLADDFNQILYQAELMNRSSLLADGQMVGYDYSLGGNEGEGLQTSRTTLTFVFVDTSATSEIPYQAGALPAAIETDVTPTTDVDAEAGVVTEPAAGTEGEASVEESGDDTTTNETEPAAAVVTELADEETSDESSSTNPDTQ